MALCREKHFVKWSDNFRGGDIRIFSSEKDRCCGSVTYYGSGSTGTSYSYTYDENGNLKTISKNGTLLHEYTYDSLNQLTTWYDATADATTIYSYYKGGNLAKIFGDGDFISFTYGGGNGIADRIVVYDGQLLLSEQPLFLPRNNLKILKIFAIKEVGKLLRQLPAEPC